MFNIEGEKLIIDGNLEHDECSGLYEFLKDKLDYIECIELELEENSIPSSALIALLLSAKKTKESLNIPILQEGLSSEKLGKINITG
mgnify:CR=1 FL=1